MSKIVWLGRGLLKWEPFGDANLTKTMLAHLASGVSQEEHRELRCRRLLFRCWHRGTKEGDLIFGRFAEAYLADFDLAQLERFEALLDCTDPDLYDWIVVGIAPPEEYDHGVMCLLRAFAWHLKGRN